ncbi:MULTISPECIES: hypothetical protein [unclassified Nostoc]|uniref:hypothetical protein n=1 Tax=unclassified Nostoc TaxID=2593658 RepID=UPI000B9562EA|nr:hypothetical protein [Nostoc sp. 'Peltigera membranacea cyanobiont' 232]OYE06184.1 hypothetical protein CDG79_03370 [Nostoc sp. 'Peltigera membranacea cyanobiont' 232]
MNYLTYHDLEKENKHGFSAGESLLTEESLVVREMIVPGMFDYPDMYVRHVHLIFGTEEYLIISMTDYELDEVKRLEICAGAVKFLKQRSQRNGCDEKYC